MICPLSMAYDGENQDCERIDCSWFVDNARGTSECAIAIIGKAFARMTRDDDEKKSGSQ